MVSFKEQNFLILINFNLVQFYKLFLVINAFYALF